MVDLLVIAAGVILPLIVNEANKPAPPKQTDETIIDVGPLPVAVAEESV